MSVRSVETDTDAVRVGPLEAVLLDEADRVMRIAFGTFLGMPDPSRFAGDAAYVRPRWRADPSAAFAATVGCAFAGSNFATRWGSVGFFGPLTIRPELWDRGLGARLVEAALAHLDARGVRHAGLYTFAESAKHHGLYGRFGFRPRFLTAVLAKPVAGAAATDAVRYSTLDGAGRAAFAAEARTLTDALYEGLDLTDEIEAVRRLDLGETIAIEDDAGFAALAVIHQGAGTEGGSESGYVKFGAARPGPGAARAFERLLDASEAFARERGAVSLVAGVNLAREEAHEAMVARGMRARMVGVTMHRPNEAGYSRPGLYAIDDWR